MATGKKRSRRGGHPAKQAARRERDRARREGAADPLRRAAATVCREAATLEDALDAELWASALLGSFWPPPPGLDAGDGEMELGGPLVDEVARVDRPGALAALLAIGTVSESELGLLALEHANGLLAGGAAKPAWGETILEAQLLRTAVMRDDVFDDGVTIFIEATHEGGEPHAVGVYIDHNLGRVAKDVLLADSIDRVEELLAAHPEDHPGLRIEPIEPGEASARISDAMELTDMTLDPPVGEDYAGLRALARLRADELPGPFPDVSPPEVAADERDRLLAAFLASPEGAPFAADGDEAFVVSLAIDFCADYVDGRPLRWSPVLVEHFMAGWLPRKVLADRETFDAVPVALEAWVRYAGRARAIAGQAIEQTVEAIGEWTAEMLDELDASGDDRPGLDFARAAKAAGVDLTDERAVATFIAGWNARSVAE